MDTNGNRTFCSVKGCNNESDRSGICDQHGPHLDPPEPDINSEAYQEAETSKIKQRRAASPFMRDSKW